MRLESLAIKRVVQSTRFEVALSGAFDLQGYDGLDAQNIPLTLRGEVDLAGVFVVSDNFLPKPSGASDVMRSVETSSESFQPS